MPSAKFTAPRELVPALGAVALALLTAACGSPGSSGGAAATARAVANAGLAMALPASLPSVGPAPAGSAALPGAAAAALLARAVADTRAASSVRVIGQSVAAETGSGEIASPAVSFDMTLVRNAGCEGTMAVSNTAPVKVVQAAGYIWMQPSSSGYPQLRLSKSALALITDKYIRVRSTASQAGDLPTACTFTGLLARLPAPADAAVPVTCNGAPAYAVTEAGGQETAFVSRAAAPLLLRLAGAGAGGEAITFTGYDATKAISVPAAADSVDGSKLGV